MAAGEAAADSMQDTESSTRGIRQPAPLCRYGVVAHLLALPTGSPRIAAALLALGERYPRRSVRLITQRALASGGVPEDAVANPRRFAFRDAGKRWMLSLPAPCNLSYLRVLEMNRFAWLMLLWQRLLAGTGD